MKRMRRKAGREDKSDVFLKDLVADWKLGCRGVKSDGYKDGAMYGRQCSVFSGSHGSWREANLLVCEEEDKPEKRECVFFFLSSLSIRALLSSGAARSAARSAWPKTMLSPIPQGHFPSNKQKKKSITFSFLFLFCKKTSTFNILSSITVKSPFAYLLDPPLYIISYAHILERKMVVSLRCYELSDVSAISITFFSPAYTSDCSVLL